MSRIHLTVGIICILIIAVLGMITQLVSIGEGIIIMLLTLISSPFLIKLLKKIPKHDDRHDRIL